MLGVPADFLMKCLPGMVLDVFIRELVANLESRQPPEEGSGPGVAGGGCL